MLLAAIAGAGIYAGYSAVTGRDGAEVEQVFLNSHTARHIPAMTISEQQAMPETVYDEEGFLPEAVLRFEHYNRNGEIAETWEIDMPPSLIDGWHSDLSAVFPLWALISYDNMGATLRKELPTASRQGFIVGLSSEGFVSVYFDDAIDGSRLKEVTDIPVSRLPEAERERLMAGILVHSGDALIRLLEDLGS